MSVEGIHAITSKFKERWLSPLQFPGSHRSTEQRLTDLENARNGQQPANSRIKIRVKGQKSQAPAPQASPAAREEIKRVGEDHSSSLDNWHAQHSTAGTDLLHTFNQRMDAIQAQKKPSESGGWAAYNETFGSGAKSTASPSPAPGGEAQWRDHGQGHQIRTYPTSNADGSRGPRKIAVQPKPESAPLNTSAAPAAPKPQRVTQPGLFGPSAVAPVRSPQQFGLAAKAAPAKSGPTAPRKPRVTQPGLFPKSAVKPPQ
jgi:hypothetical protein